MNTSFLRQIPTFNFVTIRLINVHVYENKNQKGIDWVKEIGCIHYNSFPNTLKFLSYTFVFLVLLQFSFDVS